MNPEGSAADKWNTRLGSEGGRNPFGVVDLFPTIPRVARSSQPWALRRNPFGIGTVRFSVPRHLWPVHGCCARNKLSGKSHPNPLPPRRAEREKQQPVRVAIGG